MVEAVNALQERDGSQYTATDSQEAQGQALMDTGRFLVDRDGIVRWVNFELAREGLAAIGRFPSDDEVLAAARARS